MQTLIRLLIVVAMVARGVVPAGFMPAHDSNGALEVVICTGHGIEHVSYEDGKPAQPSHKSSEHDGVCPFAASAPIATPIAFAEPPIVSWAKVVRVPLPTSARFVSRAEKTAPARAPPFRQA